MPRGLRHEKFWCPLLTAGVNCQGERCLCAGGEKGEWRECNGRPLRAAAVINRPGISPLNGETRGTMKGEKNRGISPLAASRAAAPLQLVLVCTSYEGRSRGLLNDTAPRVTGRSDGRDREVWMQFEPCCPDGVLNVRRRAHGEKCAADRDSSQPTGHTSCPHRA